MDNMPEVVMKDKTDRRLSALAERRIGHFVLNIWQIRDHLPTSAVSCRANRGGIEYSETTGSIQEVLDSSDCSSTGNSKH